MPQRARRRMLGDRLKTARGEAQLSQATVARELRMTRQGYAKIEAGQSEPGIFTFVDLAAVLGQDPGELLMGLGVASSYRDLLARMRQLNSRGADSDFSTLTRA